MLNSRSNRRAHQMGNIPSNFKSTSVNQCNLYHISIEWNYMSVFLFSWPYTLWHGLCDSHFFFAVSWTMYDLVILRVGREQSWIILAGCNDFCNVFDGVVIDGHQTFFVDDFLSFDKKCKKKSSWLKPWEATIFNKTESFQSKMSCVAWK